MNEYRKLQTLFDDRVDTAPERMVLEVDGREIGYAELDGLLHRVASGLCRWGVGQGDRLGWLLPNGLEAVLTTLACYRIGAISMPLNHRYRAPELHDALQRTACDRLVFHDRVRAAIEPLIEDMPTCKRVW